MIRYKAIKNMLHLLLVHPFAKRNKIKTIERIILWQLLKQHVDYIVISWIDNTKLIVKKGRHAATGNYYLGLADWEEMSFIVHYLRDTDSFVDGGGNIGIYMLLSSAVCKAKTITIEPCPETYSMLLENIKINHIEELVEAHNIGIGHEAGELEFTIDYDSTNHVVLNNNINLRENTVKVRIEKLDDILKEKNVSVIKLDVEGFEMDVLLGARNVLKNKNLNVILVEVNGLIERYGYTKEDVYYELIKNGFHLVSYDPTSRRIIKIKKMIKENALFIRNIPLAEKRVKSASEYCIYGKKI